MHRVYILCNHSLISRPSNCPVFDHLHAKTDEWQLFTFYCEYLVFQDTFKGPSPPPYPLYLPRQTLTCYSCDKLLPFHFFKQSKTGCWKALGTRLVYHKMDPQWKRLPSNYHQTAHRGTPLLILFLLQDLLTTLDTMTATSLVPRPLPDFFSQPWKKIGRRSGIKTKSRTGNGGLGLYKPSPRYVLTESTISSPWRSYVLTESTVSGPWRSYVLTESTISGPWRSYVLTESTISSPWRSNDSRPSPYFSPRLRDKIWEEPGDKARQPSLLTLLDDGIHKYNVLWNSTPPGSVGELWFLVYPLFLDPVSVTWLITS